MFWMYELWVRVNNDGDFWNEPQQRWCLSPLYATVYTAEEKELDKDWQYKCLEQLIE